MPFAQLIIVGPNDACLFSYGGIKGSNDGDLSHQFALYSALDTVDDLMWNSSDFFLAKVDRPHGDSHYISAYVGLAPLKLLVMQDGEPKESLQQFLTEAYQLSVRYLLNPFSTASKKITSSRFKDEVTLLYRKYFA